MFSLPLLHSLECFWLILTLFSAQLFPPSVISHVISSQVWNLYTSPKLLFPWLTKNTFREQSFHPFKDTYSTKGHRLKSVDSKTPTAPATSQWQNALCYENDEQSSAGRSCVILDSQEMGAVPGVYIPPERQQNKVVQSCFPGHILHQRAVESNCCGQPLYCPSLIATSKL